MKEERDGIVLTVLAGYIKKRVSGREGAEEKREMEVLLKKMEGSRAWLHGSMSMVWCLEILISTLGILIIK